jgi:hypothetical protein
VARANDDRVVVIQADDPFFVVISQIVR